MHFHGTSASAGASGISARRHITDEHCFAAAGLTAAALAIFLLGASVGALLPWTVAAICLSLLVLERSRPVYPPVIGELDRYLERCRRRHEPANALYLEMEADPVALRKLLRAARVTDSLEVRRSRTRSRCEVHGLLEGSDLTRAKVEARFLEILGGVAPAFGWASYPQDGLTLDVLFEHARGTLEAPTGERPAEREPQPASEPAPRLELVPAPRLQPVMGLALETATEGAAS